MNEKDINFKNENAKPLVSIGMPIFNGLSKNHKFNTDIRKALNSILNQTYKNLEIIFQIIVQQMILLMLLMRLLKMIKG